MFRLEENSLSRMLITQTSMHKVRFPKEFKVYWPLLILFGFLVALSPKIGKFKYDYVKGAPWSHETLVAQFDFPILKTDDQLAEDLQAITSSQVPYYEWVMAVSQEAVVNFNANADLGAYNILKPELLSCYGEIFDRGLIDVNDDHLTLDEVYIKRDRKIMKFPLSELYTEETARTKVRNLVASIYPRENADSVCVANGLYNVLIPNLVFDQKTTDLIVQESFDNLSYTLGYINAGEILISNGDMVTADKYQILDSYRAEFKTEMGYDGPVGLLWAGNVLMALIIIFLLLLTITYTNPLIFQERNRYHYLLLVFMIAALPAMLMSKSEASMLYMTPYNIIALYLIAFFRKRVVLPVYIISLLPLLIYAPNGIEFFMIHLVSGVASIYLFGYFNRGWKQFAMSLLVFLAMAVVYLAFQFTRGVLSLTGYFALIYLFIGSFLSVALYPLVFLFEKLFSLVSSTRLVELCDTNNTLLREMAQKAPGTFHHSLQVMNMADEAARSIGANVLLVRAGAMYHDIGKISNPMCFVENQIAGMDYHSQLSPKESAILIIKHVQDGQELAQKHNLPSVVSDFITTHHGTTCAGYFYTQYLNEGGNPEDVKDFYYKGSKPTTKEQVILMLCDGIEAASRTISDYSHERISELVEKMTESKMEQFVEADISLKELETIKQVIKEFIAQVHHSRIVYPERNS